MELNSYNSQVLLNSCNCLHSGVSLKNLAGQLEIISFMEHNNANPYLGWQTSSVGSRGGNLKPASKSSACFWASALHTSAAPLITGVHSAASPNASTCFIVSSDIWSAFKSACPVPLKKHWATHCKGKTDELTILLQFLTPCVTTYTTTRWSSRFVSHQPRSLASVLGHTFFRHLLILVYFGQLTAVIRSNQNWGLATRLSCLNGLEIIVLMHWLARTHLILTRTQPKTKTTTIIALVDCMIIWVRLIR